MNEIDKLNEAKYFFTNMCNKIDDPICFNHELSAFLTAARAVTKYGFIEATTIPPGHTWYDQYISQHYILEFFTNKRNKNLHEKPVKANKNITYCINEYVVISDSMNNGDKKLWSSIKKKLKELIPRAVSNTTTVTSSVQYIFADWQGEEDVIELCGKYIKELEKFIEDGISKRFITEELKK